MKLHSTRWRRPLLLAVVLATTVLVALATLASAAPRAQQPPISPAPLDQLSGDAFDQAFLAQMTMHHTMGVMMTQPVVASGAHQELQTLGSQMIADQSREVEQMRGWLRGWYGQEVTCPMTQGAPPAMLPGVMPGPSGARPMLPGGMGLPMMPGAMPGMMMGGPNGSMPMSGMPMSGMPMQGMPMQGSFASLPPDQLDAAFMTWMIAHHQGAIDMATLAEERAVHQEVKDLAASIISSQSAEIEMMQGWLSEWYGR